MKWFSFDSSVIAPKLAVDSLLCPQRNIASSDLPEKFEKPKSELTEEVADGKVKEFKLLKKVNESITTSKAWRQAAKLGFLYIIFHWSQKIQSLYLNHNELIHKVPR